jgi:hypothetical protein
MVDISAFQNASLIRERANDTLRELHECADEADEVLAKIRAAESAIDGCHKESIFSQDVAEDLSDVSMSIFRVVGRVSKTVDAMNARIRCIEDTLGPLQRMAEVGTLDDQRASDGVAAPTG